MTIDAGVPDRAVGPSPLSLTAPQRTVLDHLTSLDSKRGDGQPELAPIYLGALEAIEARNSDRFALASHNLRELIRLLPHALLDEVRSLEERLGNKVSTLHGEWNGASKSACRNDDGTWSGEIDPRLKRFLDVASQFFKWVLDNREGRRREIADTLHRLDVSGRKLPPPLAKINADYWQEMADYFVAVCHHGKTTDEEEFLMYLDALETFLVERVQPRTFDHTEELKRLLSGDVIA